MVVAVVEPAVLVPVAAGAPFAGFLMGNRKYMSDLILYSNKHVKLICFIMAI